jgi:hypothetical protein
MKTIPFDIDKAKQGAEVVLEDGTPVTIVNFNSAAIPGWPVVGRYTDKQGGEVYEIWPESGTFGEIDNIGRIKPLPPELRILVKNAYEVNGPTIRYNGVTFCEIYTRKAGVVELICKLLNDEHEL